MSRDTSWSCLSVKDFFGLANWEGLPLNPQTPSVAASEWGVNRLSHWPCLTVQEFFRLSNWQGLPLETIAPPPVTPTIVDPTLRLTLSVREFFQLISWEQRPVIGAMPQRSTSPKPIQSKSEEANLDDLSKLF
jgi:hypothetical protein